MMMMKKVKMRKEGYRRLPDLVFTFLSAGNWMLSFSTSKCCFILEVKFIYNWRIMFSATVWLLCSKSWCALLGLMWTWIKFGSLWRLVLRFDLHVTLLLSSSVDWCAMQIFMFKSYSSRTRRIWADIYNQRGRRPSWLLSAHIRQVREE